MPAAIPVAAWCGRQRVLLPPIWDLCLFLVVIVLQSEVSQLVQRRDFATPSAVVYFNHACGALLLLPAWPRLRTLVKQPGFGRLLVHAAVLNGAMAVADWSFNRSLATSLSTGEAIVLFNTVLLWNWLCGAARLACAARGLSRRACAQGVAVAVCMGCVALMFRGPPRARTPDASATAGRAYALGTAIGYAVYEVLYGSSALSALGTGMADANVATGVLGVVSTLTLWPALLALHLSGAEPIHRPERDALLALAANTALALLYNLAFNVALARHSAVSVGAVQVASGPVCAVFDALVYRTRLGGLRLLGVLGATVACAAVLVLEPTADETAPELPSRADAEAEGTAPLAAAADAVTALEQPMAQVDDEDVLGGAAAAFMADSVDDR